MTSPLDQSVSGESDTWMLFERLTSDGYPLVVLARTGNSLVDDALEGALVSVVRCQADSEIVNDKGMPQHTDRIYPIEDELAGELSALNVGAFHVASISGDGERRLVYTHRTPLDFNPVLQLFRVEGYSLSASAIVDRDALIDLITPTPIEWQLNGDMAVISNLEKNGDDGATPRKTDFWFYGDKAALDGVVADLTPWGYAVDHWLEDPKGVVLTSETAVDVSAFLDVTPVLVATADKYGVTYDGWETFVVLPSATEPESAVLPQPKSLLSKFFGAKKN